MGVSEPKKQVELPPLDILPEEMKRAAHLPDREWEELYSNRIPVEIVATQFCRERQLLSALSESAAKDAELETLRARVEELTRERDHTWTQRNADFFAERNAAWDRLRAVSEALEKKLEGFEAFTPALRVRVYKEADVDARDAKLLTMLRGSDK